MNSQVKRCKYEEVCLQTRLVGEINFLLIFKMYSCIRAIKTLSHEWVLYTAMYQINLKTTHDSTSILLVQSCLFLLLIIPHSTPVFHLHHHKAIFGMVVQLNGVSSLFHHPFDLFLESKPLKRKYFFTSKFMGSWITLFGICLDIIVRCINNS